MTHVLICHVVRRAACVVTRVAVTVYAYGDTEDFQTTKYLHGSSGVDCCAVGVASFKSSFSKLAHAARELLDASVLLTCSTRHEVLKTS